MGVIRKSASLGTLGMIKFRSKNEKLRRAEAKLERVETKLKKLRSSTEKPARHTMETMVTEGRKHGRRARRAAKRASHEVKVGAEKVIDEARSALAS